MNSLVDVLLHPDRRKPSPAPLRVDLRRVMLAGLLCWAVALVVCLFLWITEATDALPAAVCGAGIVLGGLGLWWERRHRASYRNV